MWHFCPCLRIKSVNQQTHSWVSKYSTFLRRKCLCFPISKPAFTHTSYPFLPNICTRPGKSWISRKINLHAFLLYKCESFSSQSVHRLSTQNALEQLSSKLIPSKSGFAKEYTGIRISAIPVAEYSETVGTEPQGESALTPVIAPRQKGHCGARPYRICQQSEDSSILEI